MLPFQLSFALIFGLASLVALSAAPAHAQDDTVFAERQAVPNGSPRRLLGNSFGGPGNQTYDYVVVGGGTAGLTLAVRLAEDGHTVAVVEAGSFYEISNSNYSQVPLESMEFTQKNASLDSPQVDWGFQTVPQEGQLGQAVLYPRGKTLGGSSARNYMAYQRGTKGSYRLWAEQVGDDSYLWDNVLPYFEKSINFTPPSEFRLPNATPRYDLSTLGNGTGPLSVTYGAYAWPWTTWGKLALAAVGVPERQGFTSGELIGSSNQLLTIDATTFVRDSSETSFLRKLGLQNSNLVIYPSTLATRIRFDNMVNKTANGVDIDFGGGIYTLTANKEVILSAGVVQSPQLLMVSGIGPADILNTFGIPVVADRPGVGQNLQDHTLGGISFRVNIPTPAALSIAEYNDIAVDEYNSYPPHGPYASLSADLIAFEKLSKTSRAVLSNDTLSSLASLPADWPEVEYFFISSYAGLTSTPLSAPGNLSYGTISVGLVAPFSRGNITLQSPSMHTPPLIDPNWLADPRDIDVALAGFKRIREIAWTPVLAPVLIGEEAYPGTANVSTEAQIVQQIRENFHSVYHGSCTCRMGMRNDSTAVVDSKARIIGVNALRVVDTSAFALLPPGHPQADVYMLAEKIADVILHGE